ncbi:MAG: HAMP domain-containing histidine kinase [Planctomycetes bacterium]|nr:HAMP domain-containing histidine kinase [Planctomycetota bacterium]
MDKSSSIQAMETCLKICAETERMVDSLLYVSRAESGQVTLRNDIVELAPFVSRCFEPFRSAANEKHLTIDVHDGPPVILETDQGMLRVIIQNLFENAVTYADERGRLSIDIHSNEVDTTLVMANSGCKLSGLEIQHICDRFWRGEKSRVADDKHSGIGLALCRKLVEVLGGSIHVGVDRDMFQVTLTLPAGEPELGIDSNSASDIEPRLLSP